MEEVSPSTDFNLVGDKMELVISDIVIITKKEKAPPNYIPVYITIYMKTSFIRIIRSNPHLVKEGD